MNIILRLISYMQLIFAPLINLQENISNNNDESKCLFDTSMCDVMALTFYSSRIISAEEFVCSSNKAYQFGITRHGDLSLCHNDEKIWTAEEWPSPRVDRRKYLEMRSDGDFVLSVRSSGGEERRQSVWSSDTAGHPGADVVVDDLGFVAVKYLGQTVWTSSNSVRPSAPPTTSLNPTPLPSAQPSALRTVSPTESLSPTTSPTNFPTLHPTFNPTTKHQAGRDITCDFSRLLQKCDANRKDFDQNLKLYENDFICSENKLYRLGLTPDGVLGVCYENKMIWVAQEFPRMTNRRKFMEMQLDGNLVLTVPQTGRKREAVSVWSSQTAGNPGARLIVSNDGQLILNFLGSDIWKSKNTIEPTAFPSSSPSALPTTTPSIHPTIFHSSFPSALPTTTPTLSLVPTAHPSSNPSDPPTAVPTITSTAKIFKEGDRCSFNEAKCVTMNTAFDNTGVMYRNQFICSKSKAYQLGLTMDGNLSLCYDNKRIWNAQHYPYPRKRLDGMHVQVRKNGNVVLVIKDEDEESERNADGWMVIWSSKTADNPGARLIVDNAGHLGVVSDNNKNMDYLWVSSNTVHPSASPTMSAAPTTPLPSAAPTTSSPSFGPTVSTPPTLIINMNNGFYNEKDVCELKSDGICPCYTGHDDDGYCQDGWSPWLLKPENPANDSKFGKCDTTKFDVCRSDEKLCPMRKPRLDRYYDYLKQDMYYFIDYDCIQCVPKNENCSQCSPGIWCDPIRRCVGPALVKWCHKTFPDADL